MGLMRRLCAAGALAVVALAQAPPSTLAFEVASIKPSQPGATVRGIRPAPGGQRYVAQSWPLRGFIYVAYRVKQEQVVGGPAWMDTDFFDMNAEAAKPSTVDELHVMLQNLLAERFQLKFHHETKEMPVYALTLDKGGAKNLKPNQAKSGGDPWIDQATVKPLHGKWTGKFAPMDFLAWRLSLILDRPVVDETGLKGGYDFELAFTRELPLGTNPNGLVNGEPIDTSGPSVFDALREQLGLRLEAKRGPADILVIDHAEKPTAD